MIGRHYRWTPAIDALLREMCSRGMSQKQMAARLRTTYGTVALRMTRLGIESVEPEFDGPVPEDDIPVHVESPTTDEQNVGTSTQVPTHVFGTVDPFDRADTEPPPPPEQNPRELVEKLVKLAKRGVELEELCDRMDLPPGRVRELITEAQGFGFTIDVAGSHVGQRPRVPSFDVVAAQVQQPGEARIFAQMTDLHYGSRYCLPDYVDDFVEIAYARGVRLIALTGDLIEGTYRHARWELTHHGWHEQSSYFAERLPRKPGLSYYGITGNHDETVEKDAGLDVCRAMVEVFRAQGRDDLQMIGARGGRFRIVGPGDERGAVVELWHPMGSAAYAISYKLQKHVESYAPGDKPDFLFCGHYHLSGAIHTRGVHAYHGGTFQGGGGPFGKALGSSPAIGGWIVSYRQTPDGTLRDVTSSWVAYYERESPRDVAL